MKVVQGGGDDDRIVPWDELPIEIRQRIGPALPAGHPVWACPRRGRRRGEVVIEWWWHDEQGELIEAFWFK